MEVSRISRPEDLHFLIGGTALHRVSLYVPFERIPTQLHSSELRINAAAERVVMRLRERGVPEREIAQRMERLEATNPPLSSLGHSTRTLVWFGDGSRWCWGELSETLPERVVVARNFALRPLLRAFQRSSRFRVLAVSANHVKIYEGDAAGLAQVDSPDVPQSLDEALGTQVEGRRFIFYRSERPVPGQRANAAIFHGHSGAKDERTIDRERYHRVLAAALTSAFWDSAVPIVLAAEVRTASELRKHVDLPALLDEDVRGNPDDASLNELHERAWSVVRAALEAREHQLSEGFEEARGRGLDREFDALLAAAIAGRIRRIWIDEEARVPGQVDQTLARHLEADDPDEDALDALVAIVLQRGGEVRVVGPGETPTGGSYCAELR